MSDRVVVFSGVCQSSSTGYNYYNVEFTYWFNNRNWTFSCTQVVTPSDIPDTSTLATKTELASAIDIVESEIPALPSEEEVTFEELDLSDYALASAIPEITLNSSNQVTAIDGHALAGGASYTAGTGIDITNNAISIDNTVALKSEIPDTSDMATKTWVGQQGYLTSVPSTYATKSYVDTAVSSKQDTLTGITDVQVVQALPASPVATVLYLIPEA